MSLTDPSDWRLQTQGGIKAKIVERTGTFESESATGQEVIIIQAADLDDFIVESFPAPFVFLGTVFYPRGRNFSGFQPLLNRRISFQGLTDGRPIDPFNSDPDAPDNTYDEFVRVTIDYSTTPENDTESDPDDPTTFLEISANASGTFLTVPASGESLWTDPDGGPAEDVTEINTPLHITETETEWSVRWKQVPAEFISDTLMGRVRSKLGTVNDAPFELLYNAPIETTLFLGFSMRQQFTWRPGFTGTPPVELDLKFLEKNFTSDEGILVTHNHLFRPGKGYRKMTIDGNALYASSNLDSIFAP